jgi:hypothetical protein
MGVPDTIEASQATLTAGKPGKLALLDGSIGCHAATVYHVKISTLPGLSGGQRLTSHDAPKLAELRG